MIKQAGASKVGVLVSGGLDSAILVGHLLREQHEVQPFYIQTGLHWQSGELPSLRRFLDAIASPLLRPLKVLDLPLADVYESHWSVSGNAIPDADSPDEAVFLPGRNALLLIKAAVWCQLHGISRLALAPLGTSPFEDAGQAFLQEFQAALNRGAAHSLELWLPFAEMNKRQVMSLAGDLPLELTFSCIAPQNGLHCGHCNKCAERKKAFADMGMVDRTVYASAEPLARLNP